MAHELELNADGTANMFSGEGITPWHGLGTVIDGLATSEEALKLAGLDWEVEMRQLYQPKGDTMVPVKDRFSTTRVTDDKSLGIVSADYKVFQNRESFHFLNNLTDTGSGDAVFSTAGSLFGGSRTFLTLKIGDSFTVAGDDAHDLYLMATNSHDGTQAFTVSVTPIRAVCNNTVTLGLKEAKTKWTIRHKMDLSGQAQNARDILKMSFAYEDAFQKMVNEMIDIEVTKDKMYAVTNKIIPASPRQHDITVEEIMEIWENEPTVSMGDRQNNAWEAFNALTFWTDHKEYRTPESKFNSVIGTGTGQGLAEGLRPKMQKALLAL
jgi:phage/plasmid-like protein (TIGR03299 family)